jgi:hypothetical protein
MVNWIIRKCKFDEVLNEHQDLVEVQGQWHIREHRVVV